MHDIDRGGSTTAVRLAALAALRNAQADSTLAEEGEAEEAEQRRGHDGRGLHPRMPKSSPPDTTPGPGGDMPAGVYAAVEAAVKKSRIEFMARLLEYRRKLDCDTFKTPGPDGLGASLDEAQFVAHRIAGVGKTLGFADLGDTARQAEAAIAAYKLESTADMRHDAVSRICKLMGLIETICAENDDCRA